MKRVDWFDEKTHVPVIDEQVQKLSTFVDAMADGVIDHAELEKQQSSVVEAMKAVEADLNDEQHAKITRLLVELSAYNIMRLLHELQHTRRERVFNGAAPRSHCRKNCPHLPFMTSGVLLSARERENTKKGEMNKDEVIAKLREHEPELKAAGVVRLAVFGSVARGDNTSGSDIDLLAEFDNSRRVSLLTVGRIESRLADLLGAKVDLSSPGWLKESVRTQALQEAVSAF